VENKSAETISSEVNLDKEVKKDEKNEEIIPKQMETVEVSKPNNVEEIEIQMPKMGESVMEGTIIKWHKKTGDKVKKDETIFEISTDKVDTEVPSPADGVLFEILVGEQETVEVGTVVAKLSTEDVHVNEISNEKKSENIQPKRGVIIEKEKSTPSAMNENFYNVKASSLEKIVLKENKGTNKFLSPLVLSIARKENVSFDEIDKINGSGLDGRVTKKDILNYIEKRKQAEHELLTKPEERPVSEIPKKIQRAAAPGFLSSTYMEPVYSSDEVEKIPMDNIRQTIMQHMVNSRDTSVHVSAMLEVDISKIYNFIQKYRNKYLTEEGIKLTYTPFVAHACVKALKEFPLINSTIEGSTIIRKKFINLGIAVAIEPAGLIVPNIKDADQKNIIGLTKSISDLAGRSRTKKLTPDDITNGTFTITNYGIFGTIFGTPIINQPEIAILGMGTVVKKPVVIEVDGMDTIAVRTTMALTLSHDHRLIDGMMGGRFLKSIKDTLENFNENSI
ncbi:MAG TPA: 2-oxo acid dehydrogenase subunit E2, partial [Ignavibacteria bacterium]|nr:2-oxo acid dehydrogenase subunit E2 [Ignavibacteria bacterium]